jgi:hypothetical protein
MFVSDSLHETKAVSKPCKTVRANMFTYDASRSSTIETSTTGCSMDGAATAASATSDMESIPLLSCDDNDDDDDDVGVCCVAGVSSAGKAVSVSS